MDTPAENAGAAATSATDDEANAAPPIITLDEYVTRGYPSTLLYLNPPRSM